MPRFRRCLHPSPIHRHCSAASGHNDLRQPECRCPLHKSEAVKKAFGSVYPDIGILCAEVGEVWNPGTGYASQASPKTKLRNCSSPFVAAGGRRRPYRRPSRRLLKGLATSASIPRSLVFPSASSASIQRPPRIPPARRSCLGFARIGGSGPRPRRGPRHRARRPRPKGIDTSASSFSPSGRGGPPTPWLAASAMQKRRKSFPLCYNRNPKGPGC